MGIFALVHKVKDTSSPPLPFLFLSCSFFLSILPSLPPSLSFHPSFLFSSLYVTNYSSIIYFCLSFLTFSDIPFFPPHPFTPSCDFSLPLPHLCSPFQVSSSPLFLIPLPPGSCHPHQLAASRATLPVVAMETSQPSCSLFLYLSWPVTNRRSLMKYPQHLLPLPYSQKA